MKRFALVMLGLLACSSPSVPPMNADPHTPDLPPPLPVADLQPEDVNVCAHLAVVGCTGDAWPKGKTCVQALNDVRTEGVVIPAACVLAANSVNSIRSCGDPSTLRFACPASN